jgi:hypothetical protein
MKPCADCEQAERDPLHAIYGTGLCCKARAVARTPRRLQRQAFDAITAGLEPLERQAVREHAYALLRARGVEA